MKEHYSCYEYEIYPNNPEGYNYKIFREKNYLGQEDDIESDEWFETAQEARFAAIGHIDLLENGE